MTTTRREFLRNTTLASSALAISPGLLGQAAPMSPTTSPTSSMTDAHIQIFLEEPIATIAPEIYSHFIEHLGGVIYDGVWVGERSKIANQRGIRTSFIEAMRAVKAPVLRWPGGCFADSYDWRDGIGPADKRPQRSAFWNQQDTNQYGLHEFMATCRAIGCEPYLAADVRTLPARDFYQWIEYCNAPATVSEEGGVNTLAAIRARNGDAAPFNVRYWGVGNETWGCGGSQTPEEYGALYRRFTEWLPRFGATDKERAESLRLVACGANGDDVRWTAGVIRSVTAGHSPFGWSTHYYTSGDRNHFAAGDALVFDEAAYYDLLARASFMERVITDHWSALGEVDRSHKVKLVMDEWGAWYGKGTELSPHYNLSQQSTMRDALLTAITLDIFQRHADKMAMANVAQSINCIHSLMLAQGDRFTLTPTFHVFKMYLPHRGAKSLRTEFAAGSITNSVAQQTPIGGRAGSPTIDPALHLAGLSGSASLLGKTLNLTVVNPHLKEALTCEIVVSGASIAAATGSVLRSADVHDHNDFDHPNAVQTAGTKVAAANGGRLMHSFPAASVTAIELTLV